MHAATEQLKAQKIRQWVEQAIGLAPNVVEALPAEMRARRGLAGVADAITEVHFPDSEDAAEEAEGATQVRRAVPPPGDAGEPQAGASHGAPGASHGQAGRVGRPLDRLAAVRADRRPAGRLRRDRLRPRLRRADAAAADGRGRVRQDGRRPLRDAARARSRPPGGADGAHGDPGRAARGDLRPAAGSGAGSLRRPDRGDACPDPQAGPEPARQRRAGTHPGHARSDRAVGPLRQARRLRRSTSSIASGWSSGGRSTPRRPRAWRRTSST